MSIKVKLSGIIFITVLSCLISIACTETNKTPKKEDAESDLAKENIKGKVKTLIATTYKLDSNSGTFRISSKKIGNYNEKGNILREYNYTGNGLKPTMTQLTAYDEKGRIIEDKDIDSIGRISFYHAVRYDAAGDAVYDSDISKFFNDSEIDVSMSTFDSVGNRLTSINKSVNKPGMGWITLNKYDNRGNTIEIDSRRLKDSKANKRICCYDYKNRMTSIAFIDTTGIVSQKDSSRYDSSGKLIESVYYFADTKLPEIITYTYDTHGNVVEEKMFSTSRPFDYAYRYEDFDNQGNWLKAMTLHDGKETGEYTVREITYY